MGGETAARHPGEHAGRGSPPGWYADPIRESSLRRWDGEHWTADVDPVAVVVEVYPSAQRHEFNWPVMVASLVAAWCVASLFVTAAPGRGGVTLTPEGALADGDSVNLGALLPAPRCAIDGTRTHTPEPDPVG